MSEVKKVPLESLIPPQPSINIQIIILPQISQCLDHKKDSRSIAIDLDKTLAQGTNLDFPGEPIPGAIEVLTQLQSEGFKIIIWSHRVHHPNGLQQVMEWLQKYNCPYDTIWLSKPASEYFVDDKAITFTDWQSVYQEIRKKEIKAALIIEAGKGSEVPYAAAHTIGQEIAKAITPVVQKWAFVGSLGRKAPTVKDIDFLILGDAKEVIVRVMESLGVKPAISGEAVVRFTYKDMPVDFFFVPHAYEWGAALMHRMGPETLNIAMRLKAKNRGWKLNQHGLFDEKGNLIASKTEQEIYDALGMQYRSPEERQTRYVKAALQFDPNSTENEGRWRLRDPKDFIQTTIRRWTTWAGVSAPKGITFIVGTLKEGGKALQAIRFNKSLWDEEKASKFWDSVKEKPGYKKQWSWTS